MSRQADVARIRVAAGILRDARGRVLIAERGGDHAFAGLWEFPGGKIRQGEASFAALHRELAEELGIEIRQSFPLVTLEHDYPDRSVCIDFYLITEWANSPRGHDGQRLKWIAPDALEAHAMLPADGPVIDVLRRLA